MKREARAKTTAGKPAAAPRKAAAAKPKAPSARASSSSKEKPVPSPRKKTAASSKARPVAPKAKPVVPKSQPVAPKSRAAAPKARAAAPKAKPAKSRSGAARPANKAARAGTPAPTAAAAKPPVVPRAKGASRPRVGKTVVAAPAVAPGLTEEERIGSAKFSSSSEAPPRVFEDERFVFPETYGQNRVRLLVKDPQWLFAHWDVDPAVFAGLRSEMGERAAALSRLTLKVTDTEHGGGMVIHLPENSRSWYLRTDRVRRAYRAELGLTLPSGEYRPLAFSNVTSAPVAGASPRAARRRGLYPASRPGEGPVGFTEWIESEGAPEASAGPAGSTEHGTAAGPWRPAPGDTRPHSGDEQRHGGGDEVTKGGASDLHRR